MGKSVRCKLIMACFTYVEPVRQDRHNTYSISGRDDLICRDTCAILDTKVPLHLYRVALEKIPKPEDKTPNGDYG